MGSPQVLGLSPAELSTISFLSRGNKRPLEVFVRVAERQRQSTALHRRALTSLSGLPAHLPYEAPILPICVEEARGSRIIDVDGNDYIDCHMAYGANVLGHRPEPILTAVQEALTTGIGAAQFNRQQVELGELVREIVPGTERTTFLHTGSEAVAASLRLARAVTGRSLVAKFEGCYHGSSDIGVYNTTMLLAGRPPQDPLNRIRPEPATGGVTDASGSEFLILPFNSTVAFELIRERAAELACVLVDPTPPFMANWPETARMFVSELRSVTTEVDVPLVFDEVVSGFRLAPGGAQEAFGVTADLACFGKITSGLGIPLTMIVGKSKFMDMLRTNGSFQDYAAQKVWVSTTNAANFVAVAASLAQLQHLRAHYQDIMSRIDRNHAFLKHELQEFSLTSGIPVYLHGHPRLQSMIVLGHQGDGERTYRAVLSQTSANYFHALTALTFYLRLEGIYTMTVPTMNLSAAHSEADVDHIARSVKKSLLLMRDDGLIP